MESESPTNPQYLKVDEAKIPLFQAAKAFQSLVVYWIRSSFYQLIITEGSDQIPLINPTNYKLEYVQIDDKDRDALMTSEGIFKTIDRFRDPETRFNPVSASVKGMKYYLYLVYDEGNEIYVFRNLDEFKISYKEVKKKDVDIGKIRSLTYAEMLYIATYKSSLGKSGTITRYPVTDERSIYPAKVHLVSTTTGRIVKFCTSVEAQSFIELPEYPVIGCGFIDAVMFHPSRRQGMTADFDGNCLTGSTQIQIRYSSMWYAIIEELDYSVSGQDINRVLRALKRDSFTRDSGDGLTVTYATVRFDELPQPGDYVFDKNHAKVYDIPVGCEVLTMDRGVPTWRPFGRITVEDDCEYCKIKVGGRTAEISTNPSVAVFDVETGDLKKVTPKEAEGKFAPTIIKDISPYGTIGTYMDGWFLGAMVSDGYLEQKYLGYTKLDPNSRMNVICYLKSMFGNDILFKEYSESPEEGANKLARSVSLHFTDPRIRAWASELDMYDNDTFHDALTKRISLKHLVNGTREFLVGLFAGLMDGDGSIVRDKDTGTISFRFSTSSKSLVESVKYLAYRLGIRYGVTVTPPRGWSKESYVVLFNSGDSVGIRDELVCFNEENAAKLAYWKTIDVYTCRDNIPLSKEEKKHVESVIEKYGDKNDLYYFHRQKLEDGFRRSIFHKYLDKIKMQSIVNRVKYWSVHWDKVKLVGDVSRGTVYDLLVPSTKVFAVNNGLIVYDTISFIPILSDEANEECSRYYEDISYFVMPDGSPAIDGDDLTDITLHAMTEKPIH